VIVIEQQIQGKSWRTIIQMDDYPEMRALKIIALVAHLCPIQYSLLFAANARATKVAATVKVTAMKQQCTADRFCNQSGGS